MTAVVVATAAANRNERREVSTSAWVAEVLGVLAAVSGVLVAVVVTSLTGRPYRRAPLWQ